MEYESQHDKLVSRHDVQFDRIQEPKHGREAQSGDEIGSTSKTLYLLNVGETCGLGLHTWGG